MSKKDSFLGSHSGGVVINRTKGIQNPRLSVGTPGASMHVTGRVSMGGGSRLPPGSASAMTSGHIREAKDRNAQEKKAIQACNMKLAQRVESVRFLTAQNKAFLEQIEQLKKRKNMDRTELEETCLKELEAYKERVADNDKEKSELSARVAGLEDEVSDGNELNNKLEEDIAQKIKQLERLNTQIGDVEAENNQLRRNIGVQEDENKRLRENIDAHKQNLSDARKNLQDETALRIQAELEKNLAIEELEFKINLLEQEVEELRKLLDRDTSQTDIKDIWKGQLTDCIRELQDENEAQLNATKADLQANYDMQIQQMQTAQMKDNGKMTKLETEINRLRNKTVDHGPEIMELKGRIARLEGENKDLDNMLADQREECAHEKSDLTAKIEMLQAELNDLIDRMREIQDDKMTLETEIACYRRLLEGEEESMERLVTDSSGARSKGADQLSDLIQTNSTEGSYLYSSRSSSSMTSSTRRGYSGGSSGAAGTGSFEHVVESTSGSSGMGGGGGMLMSSEGKVFIKKKATGPLCIDEAQGSGAFVTLAYGTSKDKRPSGPCDLKGWKVCRYMEGDSDPCAVFEFTSEYILAPNNKMRVFGRNFKKDARTVDLVADFGTWRSGGGKFVLCDPSKNEKGSLMIEFK